MRHARTFFISTIHCMHQITLAMHTHATNLSAADAATMPRSITATEHHLLRWHANEHIRVFRKVTSDDMLVDRSRHTFYKSACQERITSWNIFYISEVAVALVITNHRKIGETVDLLKLVIRNKTAVRAYYSTSYMR